MERTTEVIVTGLQTRPFNKQDWLAYSGAERGPNGEQPRIARRKYWTVVADDNGVEAQWGTLDQWYKPCPTYAVAVATADALLQSSGGGLLLDAGESDLAAASEFLEELGFRHSEDTQPQEPACICDHLYATHNALENSAHDMESVLDELRWDIGEMAGHDLLQPFGDMLRAIEDNIDAAHDTLQIQDSELQANVSCPVHS